MPANSCPIHKRPFVRGICGPCRIESRQKPAQAPLNPRAVAVRESEIIPVKRGSGRPPILGTAMTPAERKALSRANQKTKLEDAERRKIVAELMNIYRRQQADIVEGKDKKATLERRGAARVQERQYLNNLLELPLEKLKLALETQKQTPDSHGRLHNERSGEDKRKHGQSEMERLLAARQSVSSNFVINDDMETIKLMSAGSKVKPEGAGPDSFEEDLTLDAADTTVRSGSAKPEHEPTATENWKQRAIESIISKMIFNSELSGAKCLFCNEVFLVEVGAENHLEEQHAKGKKDLERHQEHTAAIAELNSHPSMPGTGMWVDAEPRGLAYQHYKAINLEMESVRKQSRKKRKKNFVTLALAA